MIKVSGYNILNKVIGAGKKLVRPVVSRGITTSPIQVKPLIDTFEHTTPRISLEQVMALFPDGKIEGGFIRDEMKKIKLALFFKSLKNLSLSDFKTWLHSVDLSKNMKEADYKEVMEFMNLHNGEFINKWKETKDGIPNFQKLALFVRSLKRIDMMDFFKNLDKESWKTCMDGIINRPKKVVRPLMEYKYDSRPINDAISLKNGTPEINAQIDIIKSFIDTQFLHSDMILHRGEGDFWLFNKIVVDDKGTTLKQLLEEFTKDIKAGKYSEDDIKNFVQNRLKKQIVRQERFMSTALDQKAVEPYAKEILWHFEVPKHTKGTMIESYNVERASEAEMLLQENSDILIDDGKYDFLRKRLELWGSITQGNIAKDV